MQILSQFQRQYSNIINLTTERSALASRILELALNRTGKSVDNQSAPKNQIDSAVVATQSPAVIVQQISDAHENINLMSGILRENQSQTKLSPAEVERTKQMLQKDISQYNSDIKLLSLLVGRPISSQDISQLGATNLGKTNVRSVPALTLPPTTVGTTIRTTSAQLPATFRSVPMFKPLLNSEMAFKPLAERETAFKPLTDKETQFLDALQQIQTTTTTTTTTQRAKAVSRSQEAVIAALLRQQGIGPNNQVPIEVNQMILEGDSGFNLLHICRKSSSSCLSATSISSYRAQRFDRSRHCHRCDVNLVHSWMVKNNFKSQKSVNEQF